MNKKVIIGLIIVLILASAGSGCFGDKKTTNGGQTQIEVDGTLNSTSGWLESTDVNGREGDDIYVELDSSISLFLNDTNIMSIAIMLKFDDYDSAHSGTDGNSPEDEIEVMIEEYNVSGRGTTTTTINLNIDGNETNGEQEYLPSEIIIKVSGRCYCEITYPYVNRPSAINLYTRDQGVAYTVSATYKFHEYN